MTTAQEEIAYLRSVIKELLEPNCYNKKSLDDFTIVASCSYCDELGVRYNDALSAEEAGREPTFSSKTILTCFQILQGE